MWRCLTAVSLLIVCPVPLRAGPSDSLYQDVQPVQSFTLSDALGKTFHPEDLRGKVWIAHFYYKSCTEGCGQTIAAMTQLQNAFRGKADVALVSINLDPDNDGPSLKQYAESLDAAPGQWFFLTGKADDIYRVVQESFFQGAGRNPTASEPGKAIFHPFDLMVVDREGMIRGYTDGRDPLNIPPLIERVRSLARARYLLPAANAALNGLCAMLLIAGYVSIRRKQERLHTALMLAALAVSGIFLASYLYYHFAVLGGKATRFPGEGWIRPVYFAVLLTHTVLAALVAPLALYVAYQGLRDHRPRHVKVARWTLPIWLYVSVTGVIVYWLLYHLYPPI